MRGVSDSTLLGWWEIGQTRHPIDRALLLCAWARPELAPDQLARLPIGVVNAALLQLRAALFGPIVEFQLECRHCGEALAMQMTTDQLLADLPPEGQEPQVEVGGYRFRRPDSRDMAAVAGMRNADQAALRMLELCCVYRPGAAGPPGDVLNQVAERLDTVDPLADPRLDVLCHGCGQRTDAVIDAGAIVWSDVQRHARQLLEQVHLLARCYGWTEGEVLALAPARRAAYLELATN